jgi:hypothetical protein
MRTHWRVAEYAICSLAIVVALFGAAMAQDAVSAQDKFGALDPVDQRSQAISAAAITKACKADFGLNSELLASMEAMVKKYDDEKGEGQAKLLIEQTAEQMGSGDGCANLRSAFKDGIYENVFLELVS